MAENWQIINLYKVGSTNDVAKLYCSEKDQKTVIMAKKQTAGRGRRGRRWQSLDGNLFFSMALEFALADLGKLVVISALSLLQAINNLNPKTAPKLKWPNDILLNGRKISGMLLEKGKGEFMIIGIGVNIVQSPKNENILYPATSLKEEGMIVEAEKFLEIYLSCFDCNYQLLQQNGFEPMRKLWEENALGIGEQIEIRQDNRVQRGIFLGIDENANLVLKTTQKIQKITAGDIFYVKGR